MQVRCTPSGGISKGWRPRFRLKAVQHAYLALIARSSTARHSIIALPLW